MRRADGAKAWAEVLSELARVAVTVECEQPAWRVRWRDGPTRRVLMDRAAALGRFRVGSPLPFEQLRFTRSDSAVALAGTIAQKVRHPVQDHAPIPVLRPPVHDADPGRREDLVTGEDEEVDAERAHVQPQGAAPLRSQRSIRCSRGAPGAR